MTFIYLVVYVYIHLSTYFLIPLLLRGYSVKKKQWEEADKRSNVKKRLTEETVWNKGWKWYKEKKEAEKSCEKKRQWQIGKNNVKNKKCKTQNWKMTDKTNENHFIL